MDSVSRFSSGQNGVRAFSVSDKDSRATTPQDSTAERTLRELFSRSSFEPQSRPPASSSHSALSEPTPPPDVSNPSVEDWQAWCEQFKGNAEAELNRKRGTTLPDAAADQTMHGSRSPIYPAGRSTVPGNENVPAFFQDFPATGERQMQLYTFCRPPPGQALNPSDRNQWVSFEVHGDICKAYSDNTFTHGRQGTNSLLGYPNSGLVSAEKTGAPFLDDPMVEEFRAARRDAGKSDAVPFQEFQNGYLVDLGGKVQAFSKEGQRLGTAWPGGDMTAAATQGPGGVQQPTGPYGTTGPKDGDTSFGNATVQMGTSASHGGAVTSLVYDGKEYINNQDHGRQMQVAFSLDGYDEALMPTEAGSHRNGETSTSTSQVVGYGAQPGRMSSTVHPAYWLEPGEEAGPYNSVGKAVNTTKVSEDLITKDITVGVGGHDNVIRYDSHIHLAAPHDKAYVEAPTTYVNGEFEKHYRFDPATGETREYPRVHSEDPKPGGFADEAGNVPLIVATEDGKHAMAIWSPDETLPDLQYRLHQFDLKDPKQNCSKLGVTFGMSGGVPEDIKTQTYVIVGTVEEVKARLAELYQQNPTGVERKWPEDMR
ncbi:hypothetical protein [Corallococcus aberystwythensis]|uniref:Uncharacterized protein n=1 Tax=Corallococcus aberystwythensis TaxID=2316722 RepID=A0A3A8PJ72_9BACT|nr:hypothetical protein [Corallococcus aberystwythensis]RKH56406.1 hypothetical protein D7W81_33970 [Corallococcus aberystwythensis]